MDKPQAALLALTPEQKAAFTQLKRAFTACAKAGLYLWDDDGTIAATNGKHIERLGTDKSYGEPLDRSNIEGVNPACWHASNSDDPLYIERR